MESTSAQLIQRWFEEVWNKQRVEGIDQLLTVDVVSHGHDSKPMGIAQMKQFVRAMLVGFPDIHFTLEAPVAQGDRASAFWRARMTHGGTFVGIAPTGREVSIHGIAMARFKEGKIVESWNAWDQLGLLSQIGAISTPGIFPSIAAVR